LKSESEEEEDDDDREVNETRVRSIEREMKKISKFRF